MRWLYIAGLIAIIGTFIADIWLTIDYRVDANISLIYLAALVTIFTALYGIRSRWQKNRVGRVFLVKSVVLAAVLWQIVLSTWWDTEYPFRQEVRFIIYTVGAWCYVPMLIQLWREQRGDRQRARRRAEEREQSDG